MAKKYLFKNLFSLILLFLQINFSLQHSKQNNKNLDQLKQTINFLMSKSEYKKASPFLSKLIKAEPENHQNYFMRATANFALSKHKTAIKDLKITIQKNPNFLAGYTYLAKSQAYLCQLKEATETYKKALKRASGDKKKEIIDSLSKVKSALNYEKSLNKLTCINLSAIKKLAAVCEYHTKVLKKLSECLYESNSNNDLIKVASKLVQIDQNNIDGYLLLAKAYLREGKTKFAQKVTKKALSRDPENKAIISVHKKIFKINSLSDKLDAAKSKQQHAKIINAAKELLPLITSKTFLSVEVQTELCVSLEAIRSFKKAVDECSKVIEEDRQSFRAFKARGKALLAEKEYERAVLDFKQADRLSQGDREVVKGYQEAERKAKQAEMKDYYSILEVPRSASKDQIKKAYRKKALKWHPDRWKTSEEKKKANKMFADINEANKVLSDDNMRRRYDAGENVYKGGEGFHGSPFGQGFPFQFRDGAGNTFFMNF